MANRELGEMANRAKSQIVALFLGMAVQVYALEEQPWFHPPLNFHGKGAVDGSFFTNVNNGYNPIDYHSTNIQVIAGLLAPVSPRWDAEIEIELESTSKYNFGFESAAFQIRRLFLNDIVEDFVSFDVGVNIRAVPQQRLHDVAVPYHDLWNFELTSALGKEFTQEDEWLWRTFVSAALGQANRGYPWVKANFDIRAKAFKDYMFTAFLRSYFGLGNRTLINVRDFDGYAFYRHQSIDVGATFTIFFTGRGSLTLSYLHRFLARTFPEDYNSFRLTYDLPFSF